MIFSLFFNLLKGTFVPFKRMVPMVPGVNYVNNRVEEIKEKTNEKIKKAKGTALRGGIFVLSVGVIIWLAIFIYIAFYYTYMPALTHSRPVHLQFKTCENAESSMCSFPTAHIQLTRRQQLLMVGQSYKIYLNLEMPESEANRNLGMFMVCLELNDKDGLLVANSCRTVMLHYRSALLHIIKTIVFAPLLLLGSSEEKQLISVEMFSDFQDDQNRPITDMYIEIQTKKIELYSSSMQIHAHFTGLRYLMFHWPVLSAVIGIGTNLFLIVFILLLSWYHLFNAEGTANFYTKAFQERISSFRFDQGLEKKGKLGKNVNDDVDNGEDDGPTSLKESAKKNLVTVGLYIIKLKFTESLVEYYSCLILRERSPKKSPCNSRRSSRQEDFSDHCSGSPSN